jgi:hypothetical protein
MTGVPVYLASLSRRSLVTNAIIATDVWSPQTMADSIALLRRTLGPSGDAERERVFRMQVTLCIHRALTPDEVTRLPASFHTAEAVDLAGGPVEVISETEEGWPSTRPCHNPTRKPLSPGNPWLWYPEDCGDCPPCVARASLQLRSGPREVPTSPMARA